MRTRALLAALVLACAAPRPRPASGTPVLTFAGRVQNGPFEFATADLAALPHRAFQAVAPGTGRAARFEGIAVAALLGETMELEDDADTAVFEGEDAVAVPVPIAVLRMQKPVLASQVDGGPSAAWRPTTAAPLLAWPSLDSPGADTDPRWRWWWVPGVHRVEFRNWAATYGRALRVPAGASDAARRGAFDIATSCIGCHRVRGQGGRRGPDLTTAVGDAGTLAGRLHGHLRAVSGSPGAPDVRASTAGEIAAFLRALEVAGPLPDEPQAPPELPLPAAPGSGPRPPGERRRRRRQIAQM